ncbi:MAG: SIS domain-containing protein [Bacteroidetes bacterium]|nr:MAG: SIS domain-containing protein [Bacteroidota bacterium]
MITHHSSLETFHQQLDYVLANYTPHGLKASQFSNVFMGGLGGSGIGATIAKGYFANRFPIPVEVVNDYHIPAYVNEKTLVILGSYSGNTEETLSMFDEAIAKGAQIIVVSAGGELVKKASAHNLKSYAIETGYQPRMALGYSLGFLLKIMAELIDEAIDADLNAAKESLQNNDRLKDLAAEIGKKFQKNPGQRYTIITDGPFYGVAMRFAQQLNENSKVEAFVTPLPEGNHNVIESYYGKLPTNFVVLNSSSNERVSARFDFITALLERENNTMAVIETEELTLKVMFDIIYALDWHTINITEPLNVDPMEIENIISLKGYLSEV